MDYFERVVVLSSELRVREDDHRHEKRQDNIGDGEGRDTRLGMAHQSIDSHGDRTRFVPSPS